MDVSYVLENFYCFILILTRQNSSYFRKIGSCQTLLKFIFIIY
jgi:hypothetical protein